MEKNMSRDAFLQQMKKGYDNIKVGNKYLPLLKLYDFAIYLSGNFPHKSSNALIRKICRRFGLRRKKILDAGSFTGYHSFYFYCERNKVVGVELSDKAYYAQMRYKHYPVLFLKGDVLQALDDMEDRTFDFIFCSNLPLHYDTGSVLTSVSFNTFMERAVNCLNPGGTLYYIFYSSKHPKVAIPVDSSELRMYCERSGLKNWSLENSQLLNNDTVELTVKNEV
ncbi:MAG TPA: class I SAM-dependent methyltransferase [Bacteroidales bacterium]|nr:class I SAM-dependent methyltransferase [Bacteroidales bacterium]